MYLIKYNFAKNLYRHFPIIWYYINRNSNDYYFYYKNRRDLLWHRTTQHR